MAVLSRPRLQPGVWQRGGVVGVDGWVDGVFERRVLAIAIDDGFLVCHQDVHALLSQFLRQPRAPVLADHLVGQEIRPREEAQAAVAWRDEAPGVDGTEGAGGEQGAHGAHKVLGDGGGVYAQLCGGGRVQEELEATCRLSRPARAHETAAEPGRRVAAGALWRHVWWGGRNPLESALGQRQLIDASGCGGRVIVHEWGGGIARGQ
eukprot:scaffold5059_cov120-Isochrysis_galbana.AAC.3